MSDVSFKKGLKASLVDAPIVDGQLLLCTDEKALYIDIDDSTRIRVSNFVEVDSFASLPETGADTTAMFYCVAENIIAKYDGSEWVRVGEQDVIREMVGASDESDGESGLVPAPVAGSQDKFLRGDGTWSYVPPNEESLLFKNAIAEYPVLPYNGFTPDERYFFWSYVTYGNGVYVALPHSLEYSFTDEIINNGECPAAYSYDCVTWNQSTIPIPSYPSNQWKGIAYGNGKFVAVSKFSIAYSEDGINWTNTFTVSSDYDQVISTVFAGDKFVAAHRVDSITLGLSDEVLISTDGVNWVREEHPVFTVVDQYAEPGFINNLYYFNGKIYTISGNSVGQSEDGINWTFCCPSGDDSLEYITFDNLILGGDKIIAVGRDLNGTYNGVAYASQDGSTWTAESVSGYTNQVLDAAYGNGVFVSSYFYVSEDGLTWNKLSSYPEHSDTMRRYLSFQNGHFIVSFGDTVYTSVDGTEWSNSLQKVYSPESNDRTAEFRDFYTMTGATADKDGNGGFVPAPIAGDQDKYLRGDGTWDEIEKPVQADYEQANILANDYIKNRPFHDEASSEPETVTVTQWTTVVNNLLYSGIATTPNLFGEIDQAGRKLYVSFQDEVFECIVKESDGGGLYIGNIGILSGDFSAEPFAVSISSPGESMELYATTETGLPSTLTFTLVRQDFKQLDEKFIPDSIARSIDVQTLSGDVSALQEGQQTLSNTTRQLSTDIEGIRSDVTATQTQLDSVDGNVTTLSQQMVEMTGATDTEAGAKGFVPTPAAGDNNKFLKGDGTWVAPIQYGTVEVNDGDASSYPEGTLYVVISE